MATIPITGGGTAGTSAVRVTLTGAFNGLPSAAIRDDTITNSGSPLKVETLDFDTGWNELTPPDGATAVSIIPPDDNTETLTLKGVTGDTGIALEPTVGARHISLGATPKIGIAAGGTVTGVQIIWL